MMDKKILYKYQFISITVILSAIFFLYVLLSSFKTEPIKEPAADVIKKEYFHDLKQLMLSTEALKKRLEAFEHEAASREKLQEDFYQLKGAYKRIEYLLEYLDPELAKSLNGAPIPKVVVEHQPYLTLGFQEPVSTTFAPEGLQVLEEILFAENPSPGWPEEALGLTFRFQEKLNLFRNNLDHQSFTDKQVFESLREQLLRAMTMGIAGFDTPAAEQNLELVAISLQPLSAALSLYQERLASPLLQKEIVKGRALIEDAIIFLQDHNDFDSFDRMFFIRQLADPAYGALTKAQHLLLETGDQRPDFSQPVNSWAPGLFDAAFLQAGFYAKQDHANHNPELVELGRFLFFDPVLSSNNKRSCASCHAPELAFTDGRAKSLAFDFKGSTKRNSPSLINAVFSAAYFWDSRVQYLQDQVPDVLNQKDELHGIYEDVEEKLLQSREYRKLFKKAFKDQQENDITPNTINRAIAAYVQSLVALNTPFDQYMRRETDDYSQEAIRGFNLFMGKAACGTCHFAPVFNGTVPPRFLESESEVLGVPATADLQNPTLDADSGRAGVVKAEAFLHSFKTPTVRNAALTAPYMHNGVFSTLEELVEFYDLGGGAGIGLELPNQTLPATPLNLSEEEKQDLITFLHSLSDTTGTTATPDRLPSFPANSPLNKRKPGGEY